MSILNRNNHHRKLLERYEDRLGLKSLREIQYRLSTFSNMRQLSLEYGLDVYDLRYLDTVANELTAYLYEREHPQQLKLIWSNVA